MKTMTLSRRDLLRLTTNPYRQRRESLSRLYTDEEAFDGALDAVPWKHAWLRGPGGWDAYGAWLRGVWSRLCDDEQVAAYLRVTGDFPDRSMDSTDTDVSPIDEAEVYAADVDPLARHLEPWVNIDPPFLGIKPNDGSAAWLWRPRGGRRER